MVGWCLRSWFLLRCVVCVGVDRLLNPAVNGWSHWLRNLYLLCSISLLRSGYYALSLGRTAWFGGKDTDNSRHLYRQHTGADMWKNDNFSKFTRFWLKVVCRVVIFCVILMSYFRIVCLSWDKASVKPHLIGHDSSATNVRYNGAGSMLDSRSWTSKVP